MKSPASLCDALISAQVPGDKARAAAEALESDMTEHRATQQDLQLLRAELKTGLSQQTVRLGLMMAGSMTLLFAALKLVP